MQNNLSERPRSRKEMDLVVNIHACPQSHRCPSMMVCPIGAIEQEGFNAPTINLDKCIRCGKCVNFCPMGALQFA